MNEKRFRIDDRVLENCINGKSYVFSWKCDAEDICDLLNDLSEENEKLKKEISDASELLDGLTIPDLLDLLQTSENENDELKNMCETLVNLDSRREYKLKQKIRELEKENERLKNELYCFKSSNDILQKELIKKVEEKAKLKTQNQGLQFKIIDMLDFVKDKGSVTREEIKEWWNNSQRRDDKL